MFAFKILEEMSLPDYFVSTSVKITSTTSLGVTGRKEKGFGLDLVFVFGLDFLCAGVDFIFINNTFDWVWFI